MSIEYTLYNHNEFGDTAEFWVKEVNAISDSDYFVGKFKLYDPSNDTEEEEYILRGDFENFWKRFTLNGDPTELANRKFEIDYDPVYVDGGDFEMVINYIDEIDGNTYQDVLIYKLRVINVNGDKYDIAGTLIELINGVYRITDTPIELQLSLPEDTVPDDFDRYVVVTRIVVNPDGEVIDHSDIQLCHFSDINREYICELFDLTVENGSYSMGVQIYGENKYGDLIEVGPDFTYVMSEPMYRSMTADLSDPVNISGYYVIEGIVALDSNDDVYVNFNRLLDIPDGD